MTATRATRATHARLHQLRSHNPSGDSGFTLMELLIAMMIASIIGAIVTSAIVTGFKDQTQIARRQQAVAQMRASLEVVSRDIRNSDPLMLAEGNSLVLRETAGTEIRTLNYHTATVNGVTALVVDETDTTLAGVAETSPPEETVLSPLSNSSSLPVFTYVPNATYTTPTGSSTNPSTCAIPSTTPQAYEPDCIGTVNVTVQQQVTGDTSPLNLTVNVDLRNVS